jgi:hypothetical protein
MTANARDLAAVLDACHVNAPYCWVIRWAARCCSSSGAATRGAWPD